MERATTSGALDGEQMDAEFSKLASQQVQRLESSRECWLVGSRESFQGVLVFVVLVWVGLCCWFMFKPFLGGPFLRTCFWLYFWGLS